MMHRLFKLEREAEQHVHDARDREIDLGGPGSARRATEVMNAPMLEVAKIRKMRQRFGDLQLAIDHNSNLLSRTKRNSGLASEVKRYRVGQAETKLAGLTADFKDLEAEAEQRFFPASERKTRSAEPLGLPATPRPKTETTTDFPLLPPRPGSDRAPESEFETEQEKQFSDKWAAKGWGGPRGPYAVPIVKLEADRREYIVADRPARFVVEDNPEADDRDPWYLSFNRSFARNAVIEHTETIESLAEVYGVNAELVKAIMYLEHAGGPKETVKDYFRVSGSILPMNINAEKWSGLGIDRKTAYDNPEENIRAGIKLIRRLQDRLDDPTVEKIATLYNGLMKERVSDYGATVGRLYKEKSWLEGESTNQNGSVQTMP